MRHLHTCVHCGASQLSEICHYIPHHRDCIVRKQEEKDMSSGTDEYWKNKKKQLPNKRNFIFIDKNEKTPDRRCIIGGIYTSSVNFKNRFYMLCKDNYNNKFFMISLQTDQIGTAGITNSSPNDVPPLECYTLVAENLAEFLDTHQIR